MKRFVTFLKHLLWVTPFCLFLIGYNLPTFFCRKDLITTPAVIGLSTTEALNHLSNAHLATRIISYRYIPGYKEGTVLHQNPSAHAPSRPHQTVFLVVASGKTQPTMKNIIGLQLEKIILTCQKDEVPYTVAHIKSPHSYETCIAQFPEPGVIISEEGLIAYIAAKNTDDWLLVPSFIDLPISIVTELLKNYGFSFVCIPPPSTSTCPSPFQNLVIDQKPSAGSFINKNHPPTFQLKTK